MNELRIKARELHDAAMRDDPEYRREYEALEEEFALIAAMLDARRKAGLTPCPVFHSSHCRSSSLLPRRHPKSGKKNPHHAKKG